MGAERWLTRAGGLLIPQMNFGKRLVGAAACCCGGVTCSLCLGGTPAAWDLTFTGVTNSACDACVDCINATFRLPQFYNLSHAGPPDCYWCGSTRDVGSCNQLTEEELACFDCLSGWWQTFALGLKDNGDGINTKITLMVTQASSWFRFSTLVPFDADGLINCAAGYDLTLEESSGSSFACYYEDATVHVQGVA